MRCILNLKKSAIFSDNKGQKWRSKGVISDEKTREIVAHNHKTVNYTNQRYISLCPGLDKWHMAHNQKMGNYTNQRYISLCSGRTQ